MLARHSLIAFLLAVAAGLAPARAASPSAASLSAREVTRLNGDIALSFITPVSPHAAHADAKPSWDAVQAQALDLSRAQHNGPRRSCASASRS